MAETDVEEARRSLVKIYEDLTCFYDDWKYSFDESTREYFRCQMAKALNSLNDVITSL